MRRSHGGWPNVRRVRPAPDVRCASFFLILLIAPPVCAQTSRGTVSGTVMDSSGAVLPGADIELTSQATGAVRTTVSNGAGIYRFDAVDLGLYDVKISTIGFKTFRYESIPVEANRTVTIDARLELGGTETTIQVIETAGALLAKDAPLRGGSMRGSELSRLPFSYIEPFYSGALPGVVFATGSYSFTSGWGIAVNGQRPRGNNFMLDGTDNNDIGSGGQAQIFRMPDAVQESSVQTGNFGVEFGRAGGGVFNLITKAGTNQFHGALSWRLLSQALDATYNLQKLNTPPGQKPRKPVYTENIYGFTLGGPALKDKTFFFGGFQQDSRRATLNLNVMIPTEDAVARLRALFPGNPRLDLYLNALGGMRGAANPYDVGLGKNPVTGVDRGRVQFGTHQFSLPAGAGWKQWIARVDHNLSNVHSLSFRHMSESYSYLGGFWFPGYYSDYKRRYQNFLANDSYTLSPNWTNEFRFSYSRMGWGNYIAAKAVPEAQTLPQIVIANVSAPGVGPQAPQFQYVNKWLFQETQSKVLGRHTLRYGLEFLRTLSKERPLFNERGLIIYRDSASPSYSAFANFLDDFSGPSGYSVRNFGDAVLYPNQFRQSYYFQDTWKLRPPLTLTLGLRYENYGSPANIFKYPAFAGFDPSKFLVRNEVHPDNNNFGPSFGFAWSPAAKSGLFGRLVGERKTVWRGGFQVSYDAFFDNLLAGIQADVPNSVATSFIGAGSGRGTANFSATVPSFPRPVTPLDQQTSVFDPNIRNPYTERWSFGFQRQLRQGFILDLSYVGSASHKLFTNEDVNVRQLDGKRLYADLGIRQIRTSQGNSNYHSMQLRVERRFAKSVFLTGSYTWSRMIDSSSEVQAGPNTYGSLTNLAVQPAVTSVPISQGGLRLDRGLSDYHRGHVLALLSSWDLPSPKGRVLEHLAGGWSLAGLVWVYTGAPFTVLNGIDRNNDGVLADRPDIGNPSAPLNTRAVISTTCSTGWLNPDTGGCVTPNDVHFVQGTGLPNSRTAGRNTLLAGRKSQLWITVLKAFHITEGKKLEFGLEAYNALNSPGYPYVPAATVVGTPGPAGGLASRFLNKGYTQSDIRTMNVRLKIIF